MAKSNRLLACYDRNLAVVIGLEEAILFEWFWNFLHSKDNPRPNGKVLLGRRWARFSYDLLHKKSMLFDSKRKLMRAVTRLQEVGLVITKQTRDGKYYAVHFAGLKALVAPVQYTLYAEESQVDGLDDWDLTWVKPEVKADGETDQKAIVKTNQNGQSRVAKNGSQGDQNAHPPIYIESIIDSIIEDSKESTANAVVASDPIPEENEPLKEVVIIEEPTDNQVMWGKWAELSYGDRRDFTKSERDLIGAAVQTAIRLHRESVVLEALKTHRFQAWLILRDDWYVQGKIARPSNLLGSFKLMLQYEDKKGREWWNRFTSLVPPEWISEVASHFNTFVENVRQQMPEMVEKGKYQRASWQREDTEDSYSLDGTFDPAQETLNETFQKRAEALRNGNKG